ncbi:hypothetical protein OROHE_016163 [Orobanche hederae]
MVNIIWECWIWRNLMKYGSKKAHPLFIINTVEERVRVSFNNIVFTSAASHVLEKLNIKGIKRNQKCICVKWIAPPPGVMKLNTDGCAKGNPGLAGAGGVLRDLGYQG